MYHIVPHDTPPKTNMEGPRMMVWKRWLLLDMTIFDIYVKFLGCIALNCITLHWNELPSKSKIWCHIAFYCILWCYLSLYILHVKSHVPLYRILSCRLKASYVIYVYYLCIMCPWTPRPMKNEGFKHPIYDIYYIWVIYRSPKNEGNVLGGSSQLVSG